jgi:hypothetical protein
VLLKHYLCVVCGQWYPRPWYVCNNVRTCHNCTVSPHQDHEYTEEEGQVVRKHWEKVGIAMQAGGVF